MPSTRAAGKSTASEAETARFTAIADEWWEPSGKFAPLHKLNPPRLTFIRDRSAAHFGFDPIGAKPFKGLTILDIGCGGGLLSEPLARLGARVTGIDAGEENIAVAAAHAEAAGLDITYRHVLPENLAADRHRYDLVLNMEIVEHVTDLGQFLDASATLVKPGGAMVLSTLNRTFKSLALAKVGAEYVLRWLPVGTHDWRKFVRPSELARGLRRNGVEVIGLEGISYDPLRDRWRLSRDLDINYLVFATRNR